MNATYIVTSYVVIDDVLKIMAPYGSKINLSELMHGDRMTRRVKHMSHQGDPRKQSLTTAMSYGQSLCPTIGVGFQRRDAAGLLQR